MLFLYIDYMYFYKHTLCYTEVYDPSELIFTYCEDLCFYLYFSGKRTRETFILGLICPIVEYTFWVQYPQSCELRDFFIMAFSVWKETIHGPMENPLTVSHVPIHQTLCSFFIYVALLYSSADTRLILQRPPELSIFAISSSLVCCPAYSSHFGLLGMPTLSPPFRETT